MPFRQAAALFPLRSLCRTVLALAVGVAGLAALNAQAQSKPSAQSVTGTPQNLPATRIQAGMFNITAMVAASPKEREIGLMFRREMGTFDGMVFVFEEPAIQCFWMRNTLLPLSAAFVASDGRIVNIEDMQPLSDASHCSKEPVRFVLEMNQGFFAKRGIKAGAKLSGELFKGR